MGLTHQEEEKQTQGNECTKNQTQTATLHFDCTTKEGRAPFYILWRLGFNVKSNDCKNTVDDWKSFNFFSDGGGKMVSSIDITIGASKAMSSASSSSLSDMSDSEDDTNNTVQSQSNDFEAKKVRSLHPSIWQRCFDTELWHCVKIEERVKMKILISSPSQSLTGGTTLELATISSPKATGTLWDARGTGAAEARFVPTIFLQQFYLIETN